MLVLAALQLVVGASGGIALPASAAAARASVSVPAEAAWTAPRALDVRLVPARRDSTGDFAGGSPGDSTGDSTSDARPRPRVVHLSDWYYRRLKIHEAVAIATLPVFAVQYIAGEQLYKKGTQAPSWALRTHRINAGVLGGLFVINTVTGVWNWWDSRTVPQGRVLRTIHGLAMLTADAGFSYAGIKLSKEARDHPRQRQLHHDIALTCIGITITSETAMALFNR